MGNVYICTGSCKGVASEEKYQKGATTCGAKDCECYGKPLEKHIQCPQCAAAGPAQTCENCLI